MSKENLLFQRFDTTLLGGEGWGIVGEKLLQDTRLDLSTRCVAAWLCTRPKNWVLHGTHVAKVLGISRGVWLKARSQLIREGYLTCSKPRLLGGEFGDQIYRFSPHGGFTKVCFTDPGAADGGVARVGEAAAIPKPSLAKPFIKKPPPHARAPNAQQTEGGSKAKNGVEGSHCVAVAPPGTGAGLGSQLSDLLTASEQLRVDAASLGASVDQLRRAESAVRAAFFAGKARDLAGLAVALAKRAKAGEVGAPLAPPAAPNSSSATDAVVWARRATFEGQFVAHRDGVLVVENRGRSMRFVRGKHRSVMAGPNLELIWRLIESSEMPAPTPCPPSAGLATA